MSEPKTPAEALKYQWTSNRQFQRWVSHQLLLLHERFDASAPKHELTESLHKLEVDAEAIPVVLGDEED